jgi:toxin-antitoxin system PIN domain toxin
VIVPDVNLFLYAYNRSSPHHLKASAWVTEVFSGAEMVGLPWQTIWAFLRISTNTRLPGEHFTMEQAVSIVQRWLELKQVCMISPGERHWSLLQRMLIEGQVHGPNTTDAELAALAIEHGGVIYSTDRDFARFPGLRWVNPLLQS